MVYVEGIGAQEHLRDPSEEGVLGNTDYQILEAGAMGRSELP